MQDNPQPLQVLLVEDDEINRFAVGSLLRDLGCCVDIAENGEQALLATVGNVKIYNLILMDIGLPDISGLAVVEKIREAEQQDHRFRH